jgi:tetratricopeptide (TPR) repeat protein
VLRADVRERELMDGAAGGERGGRGVPRSWCVPPAIQRDPGDKLEGDHILEESPGEFGLLLWWTVRDVMLWADTAPERRGDLFREGSRLALLAGTETPPEVSAAVDTLHGMLTLGSRADTELVSQCCLEVAAWAGRSGLARTAVAFAQAGALVSPQYAEAAVHVGAYARAAGGQEARAGTWLRRAVGLARKERDRTAYSVALVELGLLYEGAGDTAQAERYYRLGFRAGRRFSARAARMRSAHGLFRLARKQGAHASAAQFALSAQGVYEPDAAGALDLLLDLARFWTDTGEPARARSALRRAVPALLTMPPAWQLAVFALTARARADPDHPGSGGAAARAAWVLMADDGIADAVRYAAAVDLAHAGGVAGNLPAFKRAKRIVLRFAPQADFADVAERMANLWLEGESPGRGERAS